MKYYIIVGETSGDIHAAALMRALQQQDAEAQFRYIGGDAMAQVGGTRTRHYKDMAYMGFIPVLIHLRTIMRNMRWAKSDVAQWKPDMLILVDYPGFNLSIAKHIHAHTDIPITYYIAPKLWAWKEYRIKRMKRDIDHLLSILPFEKQFFEGKHHYPTHYVGNPTADEVRRFQASYHESREEFCLRHGLDSTRPIVALLAGSRLQEVKDNLPGMLQAMQEEPQAQGVVAGAPNIEAEYYHRCADNAPFHLIDNETYALLKHADAALVTSGTATLETAVFNVPQVVCYKTPMPHVVRWVFSRLLSVEYISLVNLIVGREVVPELAAERFTHDNLRSALHSMLHDDDYCRQQRQGYDEVRKALGSKEAPTEAAAQLMAFMQGKKA